MLWLLTNLLLFTTPIWHQPATDLVAVSRTGDIVLQVKNIKPAGGQLCLAVFADERSFQEKNNHYLSKVIPLNERSTYELKLTNLPYATYALAVFQDLNKNGKLDTNLMGIPQEPYAFSRNPIAKWKAPTFAEVVISLQHPQLVLPITLRSWSER